MKNKYEIKLYQELPIYRTTTFVIKTNKTIKQIDEIGENISNIWLPTGKELDALLQDNLNIDSKKIKWKDVREGSICFECTINKINDT